MAVIQVILRRKSPTTTNRYLRTLGIDKAREALENGLKTDCRAIQLRKRKRSRIYDFKTVLCPKATRGGS